MCSKPLTHESGYILMVEPETYCGSYCPHVVDSGSVLLEERFVKVATTYCTVDDLLHVPVFREDRKA
jgi:hypothetical protein